MQAHVKGLIMSEVKKVRFYSVSEAIPESLGVEQFNNLRMTDDKIGTIVTDENGKCLGVVVPAGDASPSGDTLNDAYRYVLALAAINLDELIRIQAEYPADKLCDLLGAVTGICLGIFDNTSAEFRSRVAAGLQYKLTGDESYLTAAKAAEQPMPGNYL
jgi:hypothetical protein